MDGLNGLELTKEARKLHPGIAALLVSGHSRAILEKDHDLSGVALLGKPVEVSVLREAVQRAGTLTRNVSDRLGSRRVDGHEPWRGFCRG